MLLGLALAWPAAWGGEAPAPEAPPPRNWREELKNPVPWFSWGADERLRQVYIENPLDLLDEVDDTYHFFRIRTRLWGTLGPFFRDEALDQPNGLSLYARLAYEPRPVVRFPGDDHVGPQWSEVFWDNLYLDWKRIGGLPVSLRIGRQDLAYGRYWVILDGTPLDGSRSIYSDAAKLTIHLDDIQSALDLFVVDNAGDQKRLTPWDDDDRLVCEYDTRLYGAYFTSNYFDGHKLGAYYIYKNDDGIGKGGDLPGRIVHTVGIPVEGRITDALDYYAELGHQWGSEDKVTRKGWGFNSELGYRFHDVAWVPRLFGGYEYLSGDDPGRRHFGGWDPVLARWPHWSELYVYRWALECGLPGNYTNLHRITAGVEAQPTEKLRLVFDLSHLMADEHAAGRDFPYSDGLNRGQLATAKLFYEFTDWASMHLWAEYLEPGGYYDDVTDDAFFLRWQVTFRF
ncbi:MAG: alginate export family protein [Candidatus Brocadiia bacterium]